MVLVTYNSNIGLLGPHLGAAGALWSYACAYLRAGIKKEIFLAQTHFFSFAMVLVSFYSTTLLLAAARASSRGCWGALELRLCNIERREEIRDFYDPNKRFV